MTIIDPPQTHYSSLDFLRGFAAYTVAVSHFFAYFGYFVPVSEAFAVVAVDLFFALSGYVLGAQIMVCVRSRDWNYYRRFMIRRWMRTLPSYLIALLCIGLVTRNFATFDTLYYATFTQNLVAQNIANDYFPIAWSLSVEEWFYIVFPLGLFVSAWYFSLPMRYFFAAFFITLLGCKLLGILMSEDIGGDVRRVVMYRLDAIAIGFVAYCYRQRILAYLGLRSALATTVVFAAITIISMYGIGSGWNVSLSYIVYFYAGSIFAASTIVFLTLLEKLFTNQPIKKVCEIAGKISYPVYLFHILFIYIIESRVIGYGIGWSMALFLVPLSVFCYVFNLYVEQPILAARPRLSGAGKAVNEINPSSIKR